MSLRDRFAAGETIYSAWSAIPSALVVDALAGTSVEAVTCDMQHGGHDEASILASIPGILRTGKGAIVRIPVGRFDMASRALDFGSEAVIAPMVNSLEDAVRFAGSMKYPPLGERSWGPARNLALKGISRPQDYLETANAECLAFAMIETREALHVLEDILAVPGIDGVFVGPSDFSIAWTEGTKIDPTLPDMMDAIAMIAERANRVSKHAGIFVMDPKLGSRYIEMGYRLLAIGNEAIYFKSGISSFLDAVNEGT
jgi:4-hydroxy-2-oxoheptanedioate aldolase